MKPVKAETRDTESMVALRDDDGIEGYCWDEEVLGNIM
jgi:hypothetical protein